VVRYFIFVTLISLTYSFTIFSKDLLSFNKFKDEIVYWQDLLNEELITDADFVNKKKELLDSISIIKVNNNVELKEKLIAWNVFFKDLYNKSLINEEEYTLKINDSTKYIVPNFKIKNKTDLKEQLKFWKNILEENIISKKQYENEKSKLLNIQITKDSEINPQTNQKLSKLEALLEDELITNEEYEIKRRAILDGSNISNNIKDFSCIKNYSNKLNKRNVDKVMCFCINNVSFTVNYFITQTKNPKNICGSRKAITYGYYLNNGGDEFHNKNSIGVGEIIKISEEEIETWKNNIIKEKEKKRKTFTQPKKEWNRDRCFRDRSNKLICPNKRIVPNYFSERQRCVRDRNNNMNCFNTCIMVRDRNNNMVCSYEIYGWRRK